VRARTPHEATLALEPGADAAALLEGLAALLHARRVPPAEGPAVLLDTPDGRLAAGGALLLCGGDGPATLRLLRARGAELQAEAGTTPGFAAELPRGALRDAVAELVGPRRLLPLVEVHGGTRGLDVLDDEGKTVARLRLHAARVRPAGADGALHALPTLLSVAPVRGHGEEHEALVSVLSSRPGLRPTDDDARAPLLAAVGRALPPPPPAAGADLTRRLRADEALRRIHRAHLAALRWNEAGVRAGTDCEFLHDWRVAVRRTRSMLGQIRDVFPAADVARFRVDLGWLARLTGPVRDLDVFLLELERAAGEDPALAALQPVIDELRARRDEEHLRLVEGLDSSRAAEALREWEAFLRRPPDAAHAPRALRPLGELAAARIRKLHGRIAQASAALDAAPPAAELHALRIECKKMRYVLDATRRLLEPRAAAAVLGALKRLQSELGEINDAHVQRGVLEAAVGHLVAAGRAPPATLLAVGRFAERLAAREATSRAAVAARFDELASPETTRQVRALWKRRAS